MVRLFWCSRRENFQNFRNVLKGSSKFPTGISEQKMCLPFAIFTSSYPYFNSDANHVSFSSGCANGTLQSRSKFLIGIFAYHLYKPSTNQFSHVNSKQPRSLLDLANKVLCWKKRWSTWRPPFWSRSQWKIEEHQYLPHFMWQVVYTSNFSCMTIFIFHIKANIPAFQKIKIVA